MIFLNLVSQAKVCSLDYFLSRTEFFVHVHNKGISSFDHPLKKKMVPQGCMQKFFQGGANLGYGQRGGGGGAEAYVGCYTLHLLGGERMTQGGGKCPSPPPLKYSPGW